MTQKVVDIEAKSLLSSREGEILKQWHRLKNDSGSHSPSISALLERFPELEIKVDACFLSNPYATELFLGYFKKEVVDTGLYAKILEYYPAQNCQIAKYISKSIGVSENHIFVGNGAIEAIHAVANSFFGKRVLVNIPTFSSYYEYCNTAPIFYQLQKSENYQLLIDDYVDFIAENKIDTAIIINPNNPTGGFMPLVEVEHLLLRLENLKCVVLDESFIHFAKGGKSGEIQSAQELIGKHKNLIIIKSMSKDFGVAGLRAGYALMSPERKSILLEKGYLWNSNGFSEYFFSLLARKGFMKIYEAARVRFNRELKSFYSALCQLPLVKVYPTEANFFLIELLGGLKSDEFAIALLNRYGIYVRNCDDKVGLEGSFIRVASRSKEENSYVIDGLRKLLGERDAD